MGFANSLFRIPGFVVGRLTPVAIPIMAAG
jgi:hypothetical protein